MADWTLKFKWQYDFAKNQVASADGYSDNWAKTIAGLKTLMGDTGFSNAEASWLDVLRNSSVMANGKVVGMGEGLLAAVKAGGNNAPAITSEAKLRASALKFLAHTYLLSVSGNRQVWLHSSPKTFNHWPSIHFNSWASTTQEVKRLLNSKQEIFSENDKKHIVSCAARSLAWVHKANLVLGHSSSQTEAGRKSWARSVVKRWFADPATTEAEVDSYIDTLGRGFKQITATLNRGSLVLTDYMGLRGATAADEVSFLNAEAFTFRGRNEGLDVVYIEKAFFKDSPGNVLPPEVNWPRILIHELTHLCCNTIDVVNGRARYAWYGIGPHAGYPGSQAITNADNWAFFCADCAGVLTDAQRNKALKII